MADTPCPLCGSAQKMKRPRILYGHEICRRCWASFINRRQLAWVLDTIPLVFLALFVSALLGGERAEDDARFDPIYAVTICCLLAIKDGFGGQFLGKALCGLQVVDRDSNLPAKLHQSAIRNWFLALPFMALIVALTMNKGPRIGDGVAKTRVIWKRHRDNPVFSSPAAAAKVFE